MAEPGEKITGMSRVSEIGLRLAQAAKPSWPGRFRRRAESAWACVRGPPRDPIRRRARVNGDLIFAESTPQDGVDDFGESSMTRTSGLMRDLGRRHQIGASFVIEIHAA